MTSWDGEPSPLNQMHRWVHGMYALGATDLVMIDKTTFRVGQYYTPPAEINFHRYETLEDAETAFGNASWVYLENESVLTSAGCAYAPLEAFQHPNEPVIYTVGPDLGVLSVTERKNCSWVSIPTKPKTLFAEQTALLALYSRWLQGV